MNNRSFHGIIKSISIVENFQLFLAVASKNKFKFGRINFSKSFKKYFFGILLLASLIFVFFISDLGITGRVVLDIESNYQEGDYLDGILKFSLDNDFIAFSTKILINSGNESYNYTLGDLISSGVVSGNINFADKDIYGEVDGYIVDVLYPNVSFELNLYSNVSENISEDIGGIDEVVDDVNVSFEDIINEFLDDLNVTEEVIEENITLEEDVEIVEGDIVEETIPDESILEDDILIDEDIVEDDLSSELDIDESQKEEKEEEGSSLLTGEVVSDEIFLLEKKTINGEVSINKNFTYPIEAGQSAKLISSSEDVNLEIVNNTLLVSTDYTGDLRRDLIIDIKKLNILAQDGIFSIVLEYNDTEIASANKNINVEPSPVDVAEINFTTDKYFIALEKENYIFGDVINIFGELNINDSNVSESLNISVFYNDTVAKTIKVDIENEKFNGSIIADFIYDGSYRVTAVYENISFSINFEYLSNAKMINGALCKSFKEQVFWSSGFSSKIKGSTNYELWNPKYNCSELGGGNCFIGKIDVEARFIYSEPEEVSSFGEGYIQISESDEKFCKNPNAEKYSRYIAYDSISGIDEKKNEYCGKNKNLDSKCGIEIEDFYTMNSCFGIKIYGSQYVVVDVFNVNYDLCSSEGGNSIESQE